MGIIKTSAKAARLVLASGVLASGLALTGCGQPAGNNSTATANDSQPAGNLAQNAAAPVAVAPAPTGGAMTPAQVRERMQRDGISQTVIAFQDPAFFATNRAMSEGISAGDEQWLALVPMLSRSGSAEMAEGLIGGLAEALPRNAAGVLRVLSDRQVEESFKETTCLNPEEMSGQAARDYVATATRAVEAVSDPALQTARTRCLANLRGVRA